MSACLASFALPMLPNNSTWWPSVVVASRLADSRNRFNSSWNANAWLVYSVQSASDGLISTIPSVPRTTALSPSAKLSISPTPITAGISSVRAMIAAWDVGPPAAVTMPFTTFLSREAVSDGAKSWATKITSPEICDKPRGFMPNILRIKRSPISLISAPRSRM